MANLGYYSAYNLRVYSVTIKETGKMTDNGNPEEIAFIDAGVGYKKPYTENEWINVKLKIIVGKNLQHEIIVAKRIEQLTNNGTCNINIMGQLVGFEASYQKDGQTIPLKDPRLTIMSSSMQVVSLKEDRAFENNITQGVKKKVDYSKKTGTFNQEILHNDIDDSIPF